MQHCNGVGFALDCEPDQQHRRQGDIIGRPLFVRSVMQTPRPINDPTSGLVSLVAIALSVLLLIGQSLFIVPAGKVAVVTTLGKVSGGSRLPGLNLKIPFVQSIYPFDVRTQVRPEEFATLTKDLQVIEATATVKYAVRPDEAGRIYRTIASNDRDIYPRIIQPSLLKALKSAEPPP